MKWKIQFESADMRIYENDSNNSTIQTDLVYTDKLGNRWWAFYDLFQIPYLRIAYSKTITDLFSIGLTADDLRTWIKREKELLRKNDPEKYEKLYAMILEKEQAITTTIDPMQQHLAIATIYVLGDKEQIDFYSAKIAQEKVDLWKLDEDAQIFFLNYHIKRMGNYTQALNTPLQTVSAKTGRGIWE